MNKTEQKQFKSFIESISTKDKILCEAVNSAFEAVYGYYDTEPGETKYFRKVTQKFAPLDVINAANKFDNDMKYNWSKVPPYFYIPNEDSQYEVYDHYPWKLEDDGETLTFNGEDQIGVVDMRPADDSRFDI
jgi:hypothetical protein